MQLVILEVVVVHVVQAAGDFTYSVDVVGIVVKVSVERDEIGFILLYYRIYSILFDGVDLQYFVNRWLSETHDDIRREIAIKIIYLMLLFVIPRCVHVVLIEFFVKKEINASVFVIRIFECDILIRRTKVNEAHIFNLFFEHPFE